MGPTLEKGLFMMRYLFPWLAVLLMIAGGASAQQPVLPVAETSAPPPAPPHVSVTRHTGVFGGQRIDYVATAGETYLEDGSGVPTAAIFSTAYVKSRPVDPARPVTFLFNGGPGSSSVWLHMGAFGPKRVLVPDAEDDGAPPYPIVDNPMSLLDVTDLVFIDPVGTGFSRALGNTPPKSFYGLTPDARSIARFIRIWLRENGRWNSPKYIAGESYGTTRSVLVVKELEGGRDDVSINGVILLSAVLDFSFASETPGNEMAYVGTLPTMTAAAWYHDRLTPRPASVEEAVAEARRFATSEYILALLKGNRLGPQERARVRARLAQLTGLSESYVDRVNLRIDAGRYYKELLRDRGLSIGRLDARYTGIDHDSGGEQPDNDPSFYAIDGAYTAAVNAYVRGDLGVRINREYLTIGSVPGWDWTLGEGNVYLNVTPYLARAMRENRDLRVFVGASYYDFATPMFGTEFALSRTGVPSERVRFEYYDSGHMMYLTDGDLAKLAADVRAFVREGAGTRADK